MKFSKFNLIIKEGDKRILFNTLSGECFKISIDVAEMIENNLLDQLNKELYDDFVEKGIIVDDQVEENRYFSYIQNQTRFNNNALSSTVLLTWACNLACIYCYEGAGCRTIRMNKATADRFIGFMINQAKTRNSKSMYINLFGGEPLLNIDCGFYILDELKKFCGEKNIEFASGIITNGTLLTAKIVWSKAEMEGFTLYTKPFHRWIYCGLYADSQFTVTPNGELYKCWEHAGDEQHLMGNINENGNIDNIKYSYYDWMSHNPLENEECKECVYLPACGGGCGVVSYNETNSYHSKGCFKVKGVLEKQVLRYFKGKI